MPSLSVFASLSNADTGETITVSPSVETTGTHQAGGRVSVATTEVSISLPADIGDAGYAMLVNRDDANFIEVGFAAGVYVMKLAAGDVAVLPVATATAAIYARANTAPADLQYVVYER